MNLQQLIELAILDAMGLLDEEEQGQFESAYRSASPPVQAQVRREQTRLSRIEALLPDVTPPAELRAAVLEAVRREIDSAEPIEAFAGMLAPPMIKSRRVSPLWRMASVGLAAAAIVLGWTVIEGYVEVREMTKNFAADKNLADMSSHFGEANLRDVMFSPDTQRVIFKPVGSGVHGEASVFLNPEWREARFFYRGLEAKPGQRLRLAIVDENDHVVKDLGDLKDGVLDHKGVALKANVKARLAIVSGSEGSESVISRGEVPGPSL